MSRAARPGGEQGARRRLEAALERGTKSRFTALLLSPPAALWRHLATPVRTLTLPPGISIVGVGGATLGGSGCTPLALATAQQLAALGHPVAFVTHGYGGRARRALFVTEDTPRHAVGDEAVLAARRLAPQRIPVISRGAASWHQRAHPARAGAAWQAALAHAAQVLLSPGAPDISTRINKALGAASATSHPGSASATSHPGSASATSHPGAASATSHPGSASATSQRAGATHASRSRSLAPVIVADGLLQAAPVRLAASLLVVDDEAPWGAGRCPPLGNLRAEAARLLVACDGVVTLARSGAGAEPRSASPNPPLQRALEGVAPAPQLSTLRRELLGVVRALPSGAGVERRGLTWLCEQRVQLALAVARPERVIAQLAQLGVHPTRVWLGPDHRGLDALLTQENSSAGALWLTTEKCWSATQVRPRAGTWWLLEERLALTDDWLAWLRSRLR